MAQDFFNSIHSKTSGLVFVEELDDQVFGFGGDGDVVSLWVWEVDLLFSDQEIHAMLVSVEERRKADNHLEN